MTNLRPFLAMVAVAFIVSCAPAARQPEPPPPPPPPAPPPPPPPADRIISVCVVRAGVIEMVDARFDPVSRDTTIDGRPIAQAYPIGSNYLGRDIDTLTVQGARYDRYGVTRIIGPTQLARIAMLDGVGVFSEAGGGNRPDIIYAPVGRGCEFQPFERR